MMSESTYTEWKQILIKVITYCVKNQQEHTVAKSHRREGKKILRCAMQ